MTHVCEYEYAQVCVCAVSRKTDECNYSIGSLGMEDGETKKVLRRVQIYIDENPGNRLLNKSITILI